jgi:hypothetical protein
LTWIAQSLASRSEVDQYRAPVIAQEDVVGLDVPVQKAGRMDLLETVEQRSDHPSELSLGRERVLLDERFQRLPALVVHHHVAGALVRSSGYPHDVRMAEPFERARFLAEAAAPAVVAFLLLRDRLTSPSAVRAANALGRYP